MKAKFVYESIGDILKPKDTRKVLEEFPPVFFEIFEKAKEKYNLDRMSDGSVTGDPYLAKSDHTDHQILFSFTEGNYTFQVNSSYITPLIIVNVFGKNEYGRGRKNKIRDFKDLVGLVNYYNQTNESISDVLKPKDKSSIDAEMMDRLGMTYNEFKDFVNKIMLARNEVFTSENEERIVGNIKSGKYKVEPSLYGIKLLEDGRMVMSFRMQNLDKIRKIHGEIGIPGELYGEPGIFNNFKVKKDTQTIYADFIGENGNKVNSVSLRYMGQINNQANLTVNWDGVNNTYGGKDGEFATLLFMRAKDGGLHHVPLTYLFG
jgi:hypothetical protein